MALGLAPSPKVWGAPCARVSKVRVRPCPKPVASMRAEGTQASEDALAQADDVRVGQSAAGPSVFASTYAVARGPLIPLVGSQTIPNIPPKMLPPPPVDVMPAFEFTGHGSLEDLAIAINTLLAKTLPETGAMLLRDLPFKSAAELKPLLQKLQETGDPDDWSLMTFSAFGRSRKQVDGLDTASTFSPERVLQCHNELGFNPRMPKRISFACIKDAADGGETLLARNADLTEVIPAEFQAWIREHGGVRYTRRYYDATVGKPADKYVFTTWQEMCSISEGQGRKEAEQYFIDVGYDPASISWEDDGCLVVTNVIKGFLPGKEPGQEMWSVGIQAPYRPNIMRGGDGELLPEDLFNEADRRQWDVTYAFRLLPSDLLIMDNLQVQHGRLPYSDAKGVDPRLLITLMV